MHKAVTISLSLALMSASVSLQASELQDSPFISKHSETFAIKPLSQLDSEMIFYRVKDCLPNNSLINLEVSLNGNIGYSNQASDLNNTYSNNSLNHFIGLYASIPLISPKDRRRSIDRNLKIQHAISDLVNLLADNVYKRDTYLHQRDIGLINEIRGRKRLAHGVGTLEEHKTSLVESIRYEHLFNLAISTIKSIKLKLLAYCKPSKREGVRLLLNELIKNPKLKTKQELSASAFVDELNELFSE